MTGSRRFGSAVMKAMRVQRNMTGGLMCQIAVSIPEEVLFDTKMSWEEAGKFAGQAVAPGDYALDRNEKHNWY